MPTLPKVVLLGFCAGDKDLILTWARAGVLPTFRSLLAKGLTGLTVSIPGFFVGSTWLSFSTGVTPARHGVHSWQQLRPGTYESYRCYTGENLKREPFWNTLSRAGRKVAVLDVPLSPPPKPLNGIQMVEWGAHDAQYGFMSWPPELAHEVEMRYGRHPQRGLCDADRGPQEFVAFRDGLLAGIATKAELTKDFLNQGGWDFFAQVFTEGHCAGHQCWHLHDPSHPRYDAEIARLVGDPIKDIYVAIDAAMGKILSEIDDETIVIVLAGHGMGPKYQAQFLLDQILLRLKVAAAPREQDNPEDNIRDRVDSLLSRCWRQMPSGIRRGLQPVRNQIRSWIDGAPLPPKPTIDPAAGKCFMIQNNFAHGGIRVNLVGREPNGKVHPGADYENFCAELTRDLMDIINLETGKPIVTRVIRTAQLYRGEYLDRLPDLLVEWSNAAPVYRIGSRKIGEVRGEYRYCRTGEHKPGGLFIALGPSMTPGTLNRTVSILDFAPTIASLLGVELSDIEGKPIVELLEAQLRAPQVF
jgi:predicted AlkP superfamily phosphohydrolase/phosphomutase